MPPDRDDQSAATPLRVVAGLDVSHASATVLEVARGIATALDGELEVVHAGTSAPPTLVATVAAAGHGLVVERGDPVTVLAGRLARAGRSLAVVGSRDRPDGPRPAGHVPLGLLQSVARPVVVVPPDATAGRLRDVLLPLDGTSLTATAAEPAVALLADADPCVTVAHVFDADHVPRFLDHPHHDLDAWGREFLARHAEDDLDLVLRAGPPGAELLEVIRELRPDLVVLAWAQELAPGRATTIRHLLVHSPAPLLLVPVDGVDAPAPVGVAAAGGAR